MVTLRKLVNYIDTELDIGRFRDYCPNGLQVEGRQEINTLVSGVTANMALLEAAVTVGADAILVHHGYFWKGEDPCITGMKRRRLRHLLASETSLLAYHLPLDAHPVLGNNAQLARVLGFTPQGCFGNDGGLELGQYGNPEQGLGGAEMATHIARCLGREPLHIKGSSPVIHTVGWCTGAAQSYIDAAAGQGLDAFISGEISEQTVHVARECGIHYFAAGHHATERFGVQALGAALAETFDLSHRFIDIDNPV